MTLKELGGDDDQRPDAPATQLIVRNASTGARLLDDVRERPGLREAAREINAQR
ncbi:hypothetical protein ACBJ59_44010 [Nonomuraea sp. MTCD27]|uniref:hypothetical protein n=1 Tax=Nonomuraea sp. MTCD27 TaxID=1676747 RepID=UPI0035BFAEE7